MTKFVEIIKIIIGGIGGALSWYLGDFNGLLYALIAFIIVDYITGIIVAFIQKQLSSKIGLKGLFKKITILFIIGIANLFDVYVIKSAPILRTTIAFYYMANEGLSILENSAILGLPIPKKLKEALKQLKKKGEEKYDSDEGSTNDDGTR